MSTSPRDEREDTVKAAVKAAVTPAGQAADQPYEPPRLIEYGPLAKITQGPPGSTGESTNFKKRSGCL